MVKWKLSTKWRMHGLLSHLQNGTGFSWMDFGPLPWHLRFHWHKLQRSCPGLARHHPCLDHIPCLVHVVCWELISLSLSLPCQLYFIRIGINAASGEKCVTYIPQDLMIRAIVRASSHTSKLSFCILKTGEALTFPMSLSLGTIMSLLCSSLCQDISTSVRQWHSTLGMNIELDGS